MAYEIETQDGIVIRNIPDNVRPDDPSLKNRVATIRNARANAQRLGNQKYDPTEGMSTFDRAAAGVGKAIVDTGRGLGQLVGLVGSEDVKESRRLDKALMDTDAGFWGNVGGNIGMALAPGGLVKGAAALTKSPALSSAGSALLAPKTIGQAAGVGAGYGFIQPAESLGERAMNTGVGGLATAAIPAGAAAYRGAKASIEPFYQAGQERIIGRALRDASGGMADDVIRNLENARELVPGSAPTAAEAANNAGIAALQRTASAIDPVVGNQYAQRAAAQNTARTDALLGMAGTGGQREFFAASRDAAAKDLYDFASKGGIRETDITSGVKGEITKLLKRPSIQAAVKEAQNLAREEGRKVPKGAMATGSVEGLHYVKKALDDQIEKAPPGSNEKRLIKETADRFLTLLDRLSPDYATARQTFRDMSRPINQMDVAQEIATKSINPLTGILQPQAFARNLSDDVAARATGFRGSTLENTMAPEQLGLLNAIKEDLARSVFAQNAGRGVGSDTVQKLAYSNILDQAGVPTLLRNIAPTQLIGNVAARGADMAYSRANREIAERLAMGLLSPKDAARFMKDATPSERRAMIGLLTRGALTPIGMSYPGLLNANQ